MDQNDMHTYSPTLLGLPKEIRQNILRAAGLVSNEYNLIHTSKIGDGGFPVDERPSYLAQATFNPSASILRICKTIYEESHDILFKENTFEIGLSPYKYYDGAIKRLSARSRSAIQKIHIVVGLCPSMNDQHYVILQQSCATLQSLFESNLLDMKYTVAVIDHKPLRSFPELEAILQPLQSFKALKTLQIEVCGSDLPRVIQESPDFGQRFRKLCQFYAQRSCSQASGAIFHQFTRLPFELQTMILSHYNFFPKLQQESWTLSRQMMLDPDSSISPRQCCGHCNQSNDLGPCCCNFNTRFSNTCVCYPIPVEDSIFSAPQIVRWLAERLFYATQTISLGGVTVMDISKDIIQIPVRCLGLIRSLRLHFDAEGYFWLTPKYREEISDPDLDYWIQDRKDLRFSRTVQHFMKIFGHIRRHCRSDIQIEVVMRISNDSYHKDFVRNVEPSPLLLSLQAYDMQRQCAFHATQMRAFNPCEVADSSERLTIYNPKTNRLSTCLGLLQYHK